MKKTAIIITVLVGLATAVLAQNKPKVTYTSGSARVAVWENEKEGKHGTYSEKIFKVERAYRKDDKWETTDYFNLTELMQLRAAIDKAILEEGVTQK